jgi:hypothetical protein
MVLDHKTKYFERKLSFTNHFKGNYERKNLTNIDSFRHQVHYRYVLYDMDHEHHHAHSYVTERNVQAALRKTDEYTF